MEIELEAFPPPEPIWQRYIAFRGIADDDEKLVLQPYYEDASGKEPRYYQVEAINRTIESVAEKAGVSVGSVHGTLKMAA